MLKELKVSEGKVTVFSDSHSAIHLCKNFVFHDKMKHVDIEYHFIRQWIIERVIQEAKVGTDDNSADCVGLNL